MEKNEEEFEKIMDGMELSDIIAMINEEVENDFSLVEEYDGMKKWNSLPVLLLEKGEKKDKIDAFIRYVDDMLISKKEKVSNLITLSSLVEHGKIKIEKMEDGHIFLLVNFFRTRTVKEMTKLLSLVNTPELATAVRMKTLELDVRTEILNYVVDQYQKQNIDRNTKKDFLAKMIDTIQNLDYYKLLDLMRPDEHIEV